MAKRKKGSPLDLEYIIIERPVDADALQSGNEEALATALGVPEPPPPAIVSVTSAVMTPEDAQAVNESPDGRTAILAMPVKLIEPRTAVDFGMQVSADAVADATASGFCWGIKSVGADLSGLTGAGVKVAVIDTGIDAAHPAFAGKTIVGKNFSGAKEADEEKQKAKEKDFADRNGHGTHCAGTIFGNDVGGVRIGVARGVTDVVVAKALDDKGRGSTQAVLDALRWVAEQKANIVSMSIGFDFPGMVKRLVDAGAGVQFATSIALVAYRETLKQFELVLAGLMLENAASPGMVIVAASGNESRAHESPKNVIGVSLPAAASPDVVSVGALMRNSAGLLEIAPFSNVGPRLCAPGVDVVSAKTGGGLIAMNGTSMACPHVAGLAALWWQNEKMAVSAVSAFAVRGSLVGATKLTDFAPTVSAASRGRGQAKAP